MRWVVRLVETGADAGSQSSDLMEISRPEGLGEIADLGLNLPEAKQLLTKRTESGRSELSRSNGRLRPYCRSCSGRCRVKDWRPHRIATLFGEVTVRLPRFVCAACNRSETGINSAFRIAGRRLSYTIYRSTVSGPLKPLFNGLPGSARFA